MLIEIRLKLWPTSPFNVTGRCTLTSAADSGNERETAMLQQPMIRDGSVLAPTCANSLRKCLRKCLRSCDNHALIKRFSETKLPTVTQTCFRPKK